MMRKLFSVLIFLFIFGVILYFLVPNFTSSSYSLDDIKEENSLEAEDYENTEVSVEEEVIIEASHVMTPEPVKALYISSWVAGTRNLRDNIISIVDTTEINAVVIDIKDSTGKVSFAVNDPELIKENSSENRIPDIVGLTNLLHSKNIYVIGRIAVFQDPHFVKNHPEEAVKTMTNKNSVWKDRKGLSWIDASSQKAWDYNIALAKESYKFGFDEINFDYVRFPSDGNMEDIYFPLSDGKLKQDVMRSFYEYVNQNLSPENITTSADLFGMTATNTDDLGIGQILEDALRNFDFVSPMVYPSHFPPNWNGYPKPATKPYEVIQYSMASAVRKAEAIGVDKLKLRPWLQDFNLGATYTADMVRAQIKATYDVGLTSWLLWDASNTYTKAALELE